MGGSEAQGGATTGENPIGLGFRSVLAGRGASGLSGCRTASRVLCCYVGVTDAT